MGIARQNGTLCLPSGVDSLGKHFPCQAKFHQGSTCSAAFTKRRLVVLTETNPNPDEEADLGQFEVRVEPLRPWGGVNAWLPFEDQPCQESQWVRGGRQVKTWCAGVDARTCIGLFVLTGLPWKRCRASGSAEQRQV